MLNGGITGTLEPLRNWTWLNILDLSTNFIGGTFALRLSVTPMFASECPECDIAANCLRAMLNGGITGTLEPLRHLTWLNVLDVSANFIGGMSARLL
jgi:hypothetical protein